MLPKHATVDEHAVKAAGGRVLEDGSGVSVGGWTVSSSKGPITSDAECEVLKEELGAPALPEQYYGDNCLTLSHEASGVTLSFTARAALQGWLGDSSERVQVEAAGDWLASRQREVKETGAKTLEYDWTFTTSYQGSVNRSGHSSGDSGRGSGNSGSDGWEEAGEHAINRSLLMSRDPFLYFDELLLYESELEDNGISQVSAKVRVMPRCWFVLLRFWLRVDRVLLRLREVRLFCQYDTGVVVREVRHHEGTFAALAAAGAPAEGPAYADAHSAASALQAAAPVGVTRYSVQRLRVG